MNNKNILIVDDEAMFRFSLKIILKKHGFMVYEAGNGLEGLEVLSNQGLKVDLVITDIKMPKMGGLEMIENMVRQGGKPEIIAMTGYGEKDTQSRLKKMNCKWLLFKPFKADDLLRTVNAAIGKLECVACS
ncbi:response regulator [Desulfonatronovibrio hydrogenovorans]|uniref:response regulator n=1 Tax=Desulfonatronovibrio hydrogenovorans TaxID=53245 RepID=UPI00068BEA25|nr:response regulator [Desulfonatronovibrio hydrogenovorans]